MSAAAKRATAPLNTDVSRRRNRLRKPAIKQNFDLCPKKPTAAPATNDIRSGGCGPVLDLTKDGVTKAKRRSTATGMRKTDDSVAFEFCCRPRLKPRLRKSVPTQTPAAKPARAVSAVGSPPASLRKRRMGQPIKSSAPKETSTPTPNCRAADGAESGLKLRVRSAAAKAPKTSANISGRRNG